MKQIIQHHQRVDEAYEIEHLSSLFALLVRHLELKANNTKGSVGESMSNSFLLELLRKCLLVSSLCNDHLLDSALHIAQLVGNSVLMEDSTNFVPWGRQV